MVRWSAIAAVSTLVASVFVAMPAAAGPGEQATPPQSAASPARVAADYPGGKGRFANPGVIYDGSKWVLLNTGSWSKRGGTIAKANVAKGPWRRVNKPLLTKRPAWAHRRDHSVWAPSVVRSSQGHYVVYYAARVKGTKENRCIGTGHSQHATGPFTPNQRPIACYRGSGTRPHDAIKREGRRFSLIDATPAHVGNGRIVLTYKTGFRRPDGRWHTTTRMLKVNSKYPGRTAPNRRNPGGGSIKITDEVHRYIEENPVLVKRGNRYTLFTSMGWYGTCDYWTRYRQNGSLWYGWLRKGTRPLPMPDDTCGTGNAHVVRGLPKGSWRIFYNGHINSNRRSPFTLYVGWMHWRNGRPIMGDRL